jgi:hypothetical protein
MKKRLTLWRSIIFLSLIVLALLAGQTVLFLFGEDSSRSPGYAREYPDSGYYEINPGTILASLDQGKTDVFVPFLGDPDRDEPHYDSIAWTQADYLKIANALSLEAWNEPLDLESWKTEYIRLVQKCENDPRGFHTFAIVYSKELGMRDLERRYVTRLIEINAWQGLIYWGKNATFSAPLLLGWDGAELTRFKIVADDALQIAEKSGGSNIRSEVNNNCRIILSVNQLSTLPHQQNWLVDYERTKFYVHINPYTGKYKIRH